MLRKNEKHMSFKNIWCVKTQKCLLSKNTKLSKYKNEQKYMLRKNVINMLCKNLKIYVM